MAFTKRPGFAREEVGTTVSQTIGHYTNFDKGKAWHLVLQQTPTASADTFFYFKNTSSVPVVMEGFSYRVASAESVKIFLGTTGTPSGGTTLTPVNLKSSSALQPTGTIEAGNDITGLTNGDSIGLYYLTSTETKIMNFEQDLVLDTNGVVTFEAQTGGVLIDMIIPIYETSV